MHLSRALDAYARQHKAAHIVSKTARTLLPFYQSMGFRIFGKPFYSDWFDDKAKQDPSIPIIYDFAPIPEEEVLVWWQLEGGHLCRKKPRRPMAFEA